MRSECRAPHHTGRTQQLKSPARTVSSAVRVEPWVWGTTRALKLLVRGRPPLPDNATQLQRLVAKPMAVGLSRGQGPSHGASPTALSQRAQVLEEPVAGCCAGRIEVVDVGVEVR